MFRVKAGSLQTQSLRVPVEETAIHFVSVMCRVLATVRAWAVGIRTVMTRVSCRSTRKGNEGCSLR